MPLIYHQTNISSGRKYLKTHCSLFCAAFQSPMFSSDALCLLVLPFAITVLAICKFHVTGRAITGHTVKTSEFIQMTIYTTYEHYHSTACKSGCCLSDSSYKASEMDVCHSIHVLVLLLDLLLDVVYTLKPLTDLVNHSDHSHSAMF